MYHIKRSFSWITGCRVRHTKCAVLTNHTSYWKYITGKVVLDGTKRNTDSVFVSINTSLFRDFVPFFWVNLQHCIKISIIYSLFILPRKNKMAWPHMSGFLYRKGLFWWRLQLGYNISVWEPSSDTLQLFESQSLAFFSIEKDVKPKKTKTNFYISISLFLSFFMLDWTYKLVKFKPLQNS